MTRTVIQRLRRLQGLGIVTPAHCIRAERWVERHPEIFSDATGITVNQAVDLAFESATLPMRLTPTL
jgi:hypothetical protein